MRIDAPLPIDLNPAIKEMQTAEKPTLPFINWLTDTVVSTNQQLLAADNVLQQLASGQAVSLHQTMLTLEEAKLSFQYLEQIRNRLMTAYQDILREQI